MLQPFIPPSIMNRRRRWRLRAGYCYWALNRLFYEPKEVLDGPFVGGLKSVLEFAGKHEALLRSVAPQPQVGILTGAQTV